MKVKDINVTTVNTQLANESIWEYISKVNMQVSMIIKDKKRKMSG